MMPPRVRGQPAMPHGREPTSIGARNSGVGEAEHLDLVALDVREVQAVEARQVDAVGELAAVGQHARRAGDHDHGVDPVGAERVAAVGTDVVRVAGERLHVHDRRELGHGQARRERALERRDAAVELGVGARGARRLPRTRSRGRGCPSGRDAAMWSVSVTSTAREMPLRTTGALVTLPIVWTASCTERPGGTAAASRSRTASA
jgi:hypothetical protein